MDKIIDFLNLPVQIDMEDNCEYEFNDYDEFTEIYNKLEKTRLVSKNSPQSYLNINKCHIEFDGDDFYIYLEGDFNIDKYKLKIEGN